MTFHITGLWQYGTDLSKQYTQTAVDSSSLPSAHTFRADSYFLQQYLLHHKLALRGGLIAAYDSYGDSEYGASFINLALGYAHSNLNSATYLSFNPAGVPSFEVKVFPTDHLYVKAMVQSEERDPYTTDPTGFTFHLGGAVPATEAGYLHDPPKPPDATSTMGPEPFITQKESGNYPGVYRFGAGYDPHNFKDLLTECSPGATPRARQWWSPAFAPRSLSKRSSKRGSQERSPWPYPPDLFMTNAQGVRASSSPRGRPWPVRISSFVRDSDLLKIRRANRLYGCLLYANFVTEVTYSPSDCNHF
jgi:hypothetical protein